MFSRITASLLFLSLITAPLCAKELDSKIEKTARKLSVTAATQNLSTSTLAVFPFQADDKLSKKKVNVAVSEMLATSLLKFGTFKLTERARLEEVMKEQKLGLSGAVDSKTAADIGKLMGAKLMVLGNVIQVGNFYQITSKLVNSESSEIITSEVFEVPVKTFDEDAERYLVLVPDTQAIGLYLGLVLAPVTIKTVPPSTVGTGTLIPGGGVSGFIFPGVGVRYFFSGKWMIDAFLGLAPAFTKVDDADHLFTITNGNASITQHGTGLEGSTMVRLFLSRSLPISEKFRLHPGVGFLSMSAGMTEESSEIAIPSNPPTSYAKYLGMDGTTYNTPFVRLGLEWRPQVRLGWSVVGAYNFLKKDHKGYAEFGDKSGSNIRENVLVQQFTFPQVMLETTFSFYF